MIISKDMAATAIVAASASSRGIGWKGDLPWKLPGDMKHFSRVTRDAAENKTNAVVMGRKTWDSIPAKFRPLPGRTNVVLTSKPQLLDVPPEVLTADSLADAWNQLGDIENLGRIFIIGGAQIYQEAIEKNFVHKVILTEVDTPDSMQFDTFFPVLDPQDWCLQDAEAQGAEAAAADAHIENGLTYSFKTYTRPNRQEEQYLDLIRKILKEGIVRGDRTGTGTKRYVLVDGRHRRMTKG